jgi:DNA (cytosine-5)-methyltransferase 1
MQGGNTEPRVFAQAVLTPDRVEKRQNGRRFKEDGEPAFTVTAQDRHGVAIGMTRRAESQYRERKENISGTVTATYYKGIGNAERPGVKEGLRIRRLTPLECERLQGFPDNWTAEGRNKTLCNSSCEIDHIHGTEPMSDTQRYKMCGNAVTTNTVEAVMTNLIKHMED